MYPLRSFIPHQHFGGGSGLISDEDQHIPPSFGHLHHHFPLHLLPHKRNGFSEVITTPGQYQIKLDVLHFSPDELTVKAGDKCVIVEGKHEEKEDEHGYISRSFIRRYLLPADVNPDDFDEKVVCELGPDGVLQISITRPVRVADKVDMNNAKVLPIKFTGTPNGTSSGKG